MSMGKNVQNNRFWRLFQYRVKRVKEHLDELTWCTPKPHCMWQIVKVDGHGNSDDVAFWIPLQIWQIVVKYIAMPAVPMFD